MKGIDGHHSARMGKDEWLTPRDILEALGPFDLDPCAPVEPPWPIATTTYNMLDDGLRRPWSGFIWCNPPYGQETGRWLNKMGAHGNGIALVFARTETEMFFESVWRGATSMLFLEGASTFTMSTARGRIRTAAGRACCWGSGMRPIAVSLTAACLAPTSAAGT